MKKLFLISAILLIAASSKAQIIDCGIRGEVIDYETSEPIYQIKVLVLDADSLVSDVKTDFDGAFVINPITCKKCFLAIEVEGYKSQKFELNAPESGKWIIMNKIVLQKK